LLLRDRSLVVVVVVVVVVRVETGGSLLFGRSSGR
jgi:hypothetical protein